MRNFSKGVPGGQRRHRSSGISTQAIPSGNDVSIQMAGDAAAGFTNDW